MKPPRWICYLVGCHVWDGCSPCVFTLSSTLPKYVNSPHPTIHNLTNSFPIFFFWGGDFGNGFLSRVYLACKGGGQLRLLQFHGRIAPSFFSKLGTNGRQKEREKKNTHSKMGGGGYPAAFYGPDVSGLSIPSAWAMDIFYGGDVNSRTAPSTFTIEPRKGNG